ncbi:MAG TPA: hypothetical protein VMT75_08145 [Candidatus Saccharimonadales bacterium]|nr:hypothetical protein [Candidatus Saccharimonadales bacterium]
MKRLIAVLVSAVVPLVWAAATQAQDLLVPAGTLLQCTLDEPNFSSATAAIGDPVVCHLRTMQQFGKQVFPRGSMLGGHLEADKEPGHFVGKGYLKVTFDRVILPSGDMPVPAKVIQARGYKVDKEGAIDGKGHATRDVVEWMIPPLWPWKVISLPFRGPRPTLKGEEPLELRLMDDIVIPQPAHPDRPPYASSFHPTAANTTQQPAGSMQLLAERRPPAATEAEGRLAAPAVQQAAERFTILVLKSNQEIEVTKYKRDGDLLMIQDSQGRKGSVAVTDVDWRRTSEMTGEVRSVDTRAAALATN